MLPSQRHVFSLVLLLSTFKGSHCFQSCSLCSDGSTVTKPDYFIGWTNPYVINTCKDLSDGLLFIDADSDACFEIRSWGAICGCPVAENSCSICEGSQNITKPQQVLDTIGNPYVAGFLAENGIAVTCEFQESVMQTYQNGDDECLKQMALPIDDLRRYCGCPSEDEEESNECTLCPGGEILPPQSGVDTFISIGNEDTVSCEEANTLVTETEKGTEVCNQIQRLSTLCGCPIPENACRLCKNRGYVTKTGTVITTPSGERVQCESFEAQLHNFESSSIECTSLDESYADQCGCSESEAFIPCTLCGEGEEVPFPDKEITGTEGVGLDFVEPTCGALASVALIVRENSQDCRWARTLAQLCDCKPRDENICTICGGGDIMSNPFQDVVFAFGPINSMYPEVFRGKTSNRESSCEVAESSMASLYTQDDSWCYWNQLMRGQVCGCPDNSDIIVLVWTQRWSGILSLSGSLLIIISIITKAPNLRWAPYNQIVLGISFFDLLSSTAYIIGTAFTPVELGLHGSFGNNATCGFEAWLFQIGTVSVYYNVLLCAYFLLVVKYDWTERKFSKIAKWVHLGAVAIGLIMAFAVIPFASPDWRWCYLGTPPQTASWLPGVFFFIIPVALCILAMTVLTVIFVRHVQQVYRKTQSKSMHGKGQGKGSKRGSLASRTFWQSVWFLAAFYAVWPIQFAAFVVPTVPSNYWIYVLAAILGPLQGFLNALVVFSRDRESIQRRVSQSMRKLRSRFGAMFTSTGSASEVVGAELAGVEESKQPVEYSVEGQEASQLKIDVGQLNRLEAEEKTPEGALNGEGGVSVEALDESNEGLLEHAMNAGLLNDDDRELFRGTIARIQSRRTSRFMVE